MKKIVILTGAGISAESGIQTFRGSGGLWEGHDVMEVASPEGWHKNPELVLNFYNLRRKAAAKAEPNAAHLALVELEAHYQTQVITQNVDDLHERAGSSSIMHLHGMLRNVRSSADPSLIYNYGDREIQMGDTCELGSQLRPDVVWFGEAVPMIEPAVALSREADIFIVIGTSMAVYPAASLIHYVPADAPKFLVDPNRPDIGPINNLQIIQKPATTGVRELVDQLIQQANA